MKVQRLSLTIILALSMAGLLLASQPENVCAISPDIVISQVYGAGGNSGAIYTHDFIELFNRGTTTVSLAGWSVQYTSATGTGNFGSSATLITPLSGSLAPGQYFLIQEAQGSGGTTPLPAPDVTDATPINMSGTAGKVALVNTTTSLGCNGGSTPCSPDALATIIDLVGWGSANFFEGSGPAPATINTTAVFRADGGCTDTDNNASDFTAGAPTPRNTASPVHICAVDAPPTVVSTLPAAGAIDVPVGSDITVTFSEPVNVSGTWYDMTCSTSGAHTASVSGGPTTFILNPVDDFSLGEACTLTVYASQVTDQDSDDPPDAMAADFTAGFTTFTGVDPSCMLEYTPIYQIQGSGAAAAITGTVTTQGVVVGDYEGPSPALRGFYIQDPTGDTNPSTSDGIFIFNGNNDDVTLGDVVRVTGTAAEFQGQTQITASSIAHCGTGSATPVDVTLPFDSADYPERYEGMLVRLPQTLFVTEHYLLGRFGQIAMSSADRLYQPTSLVEPGPTALALQEVNNLNRILIDDALNNQNPDPVLFGRGGLPLSASNTLRGSDTATGIVGVMTYGWGGNSASPNAYRVRPVNALGGAVPDFQPANPRPGAAPSVGGTLRVAGLTLLNFFNTFGPGNCTNGVGGTATDCRGADTQVEFGRQWVKTVASIIRTDADVIGVTELENDGYGPDSAIRFLVDKLNEATSPGTYDFMDADSETGEVNVLGTDAIKVGLIYKPAVVTSVGQTAVLNTDEFVTGGDSVARNRPALAQAFEQNANGERFVFCVNHLKSKGTACDDPDAGDGQGNCTLVRLSAANLLTAWLASDPTGIHDPDVLIMGDLNAYAMEDPITAITSEGYTDLIYAFQGLDAYSYVFDGQWGYLDHALGSASLADQVAGATHWHVNADEPSALDYNTDYKTANLQALLYAPDEFRSSDHDPVIVGLNLESPNALRLFSPNGGERIPAGDPSYHVAWEAPVKAIQFKLKYSLDNGATWKAMVPGFLAGYSYEWQVPVPASNRPQCLVKVIGYNANTVKLGQDKSDGPFTIEVASITAPVKDEIVPKASAVYAVTWTTNGISENVSSATVFYTLGNSGIWKKAAGTMVDPLTSFHWDVPSPAKPIKAKLKVMFKDVSGNKVATAVSSVFRIE